MQFKLLTALIFAIVCFSQLSPVQTDFIIDPLINQANKAIGNLDNSTQAKINNSLIVIQQLQTNCTSQGQISIEGAKSSLSIIIANAQKEIDEIEKNAKEHGIDISGCLVNVTNGFKQVSEEFLQNEINCVTSEINRGLKIMSNAFQTVNNASKEVAALPGKLEACGTSLFCINNLIKEIENLAINLPIKIAKVVTEATVFVGGLKVRLEACAAIQIAKGAFSAVEEIVTNVRTCAANLTQTTGNINELVKQAEEAIERFQNATKGKIQVSLTVLIEFKINCTLQKQDVIEEAKLELNLTIVERKKQIEEIKKKAEENGTDISQCLVNVTNSFKNVSETCLQNEINCVTKEINRGLNIIEEATQSINKSSKEVGILREKLKACGTNLSSSFCIINVTKESDNLAISVPLEITKEVTEATVFVVGLKFRLETCAAIEIAKGAVSALNEIVKDVITCADTIIPVNGTESISALINQTETAIKKLQITIQGQIQISFKVLIELKSNCTLQKQAAIEEAKLELNLTIVNGHKEIEEIKKKAEENGTDISQCLVNVTTGFKQIFETWLQNEINCVTKEINQSLNIIDNATHIINNTAKTVEDLREKLKACGTNKSSRHCIENIATEAANLAISLSLEITKEVTEATVFVVGLKFRLESCAVIEIAKGAVSAVKEIVEDVTTCANELCQGNKTENITECIEQADDAIERLKNVTKEKIEVSIKVLIELKENCTLQEQEVIEEVKLELNLTIIVNGQKQIDEIKKIAEENGTDISQCLVNVTTGFNQIFETCLQNEMNCVTKEINQGLIIIKNATQNIKNTSKQVEILQEKLTACGTNESSRHCIDNVTKEADSLAISLSLEITKEVTEATVFVVGLKFRLETCAATQIVTGAVSAVKEIVKDVTTCANNLMQGTSGENIIYWIKQAEDAIKKLKDAIQEKTEDTMKVLVEFKNNCSLQEQDAIESGKLELNLTIVNGQKLIDEITEEAEKNRTDISQCLVNVTTGFKQVFETFLQNEINCVTKEIKQGLIIVDNANQTINKSSTKVETLQEKLKACGTNQSSILCIKNIATEANNLTIILSLEISKEVTDATVFIVGLKFRLETCAAIQIAKGAGSAVKEIVTDVTTCANNLMKINTTRNISDCVNQAKTAIEILKNATDEKIQVSMKVLVELKRNCTIQEQDAIESAKLELNLTIVNGHKEIEEIKKKAEENGLDISQCLVNVTTDFNQIYETFLHNEMNCITKEINQGENIINHTNQIINNSSREVETLQEKLKACGTNESSRRCIENVTKEAENLTISLPLEIAKEVTAATVFVVGLKFRLETCAAIEIAKGAVSAVKEIVEDVAMCVDNLIQKHPGENSTSCLEQAKKAIEKLNNATQEKNDVSVKVVEELKENCTLQEQEAIEEAKLELNLTIVDGQKQIDEIKNKAEENGANISQCLVNVTTGFKQVSQTFLQNVNNCVTKEINQSLITIKDATQSINNSIKDIKALQAKFNLCEKIRSSEICFKSVTTQAQYLAISLPLGIANEISEATMSVGGLKFRLDACVAIQIAKAAKDVEKIVLDVSKCAIGLLANGTICKRN